MAENGDKAKRDARGSGGGSKASDDSRAWDEGTLLAEVEQLLIASNYEAIVELLGPHDRAKMLPPALTLIYATALKEYGVDEQADETNRLAIDSMATLFNVEPDSRTALMFAKRLIRTNPVAWKKRKAPQAPARIALIILGLFFGCVVGWLLAPGSVNIMEVIKTLP